MGSGEDSLLWDSWSKATGGTRSWRRRRSSRESTGAGDTSFSSLGSDSSADASWVAGACALPGQNEREGETRVAVAADAQARPPAAPPPFPRTKRTRISPRFVQSGRGCVFDIRAKALRASVALASGIQPAFQSRSRRA